MFMVALATTMAVQARDLVLFSTARIKTKSAPPGTAWGEISSVIVTPDGRHFKVKVLSSDLTLDEVELSEDQVEFHSPAHNITTLMDDNVDLSFLERDLPEKAPSKKDRVDSYFLLGKIGLRFNRPVGRYKKQPAVNALAKLIDSSGLRPAMEGIYHDAAQKLMVSTDGHVLAWVQAPHIKETINLHATTGQVIPDRFPDYEPIMFSHEREAYCHDLCKLISRTESLEFANRFITDPIFAAVEVDGKLSFFTAEAIKKAAVFLAEMGVPCFKVCTSRFKPNLLKLHGTGTDGKQVGCYVMKAMAVKRFAVLATFATERVDNGSMKALLSTELKKARSNQPWRIEHYATMAASTTDPVERAHYEDALKEARRPWEEEIASLEKEISES
jgi:hypothetical protein